MSDSYIPLSMFPLARQVRSGTPARKIICTCLIAKPYPVFWATAPRKSVRAYCSPKFRPLSHFPIPLPFNTQKSKRMARSSAAIPSKKARAHKDAKNTPAATAKTSAKSAPKAAGKAKAVPHAPAPVEEDEEAWEDEDEDGDEEDEDEDDGVDEEGMARLMKLLGDDGLDDVGQAQLDALVGSGSGSGSEDENDEEEEEGEDVEEGEDSEVDNEDEANDSEEEHDEEDVDMGEDEDEEAIPLDEAETVDEDAVPRQKVEIDNKVRFTTFTFFLLSNYSLFYNPQVALEQIRESIKLDASLPWTETLVLSYPHTIDVDVDDDLNRELALYDLFLPSVHPALTHEFPSLSTRSYKQALHSANEARTKAAKLNFPFTRPADYFAEMIKSDAHMERIRIRLLDESAGIKKSELKRKEREGKKFGKQIQVEKIKEREKSKKEMEERLKGLKRSMFFSFPFYLLNR